MADTHIDNLKITVSGTPGTGTITQAAAVSGCQALVAGDAGITISIRITDGTAWETATGCAVADSGGGVMTITRGTFQDSSTGSALSLTSAAVVECSPVADFGNRMESAALTTVTASPTTSNVTAVIGTLHRLDISGLTANRNFVLPAPTKVDQRIAVKLSAGDDTYALVIIGDTGVGIEGGAAATEWSRLFITNESVVFRSTSTSNWDIEAGGDGRKACNAGMEEATTTTLSHSTFTKITLDTEVFDVGDIADPTTNNRFNIRRPGNYSVSALMNVGAVTDGTRIIARVYKNGSFVQELARSSSPAVTGTGVGSGVGALPLDAGDYIELWGFWSVTSGTGTKDTDVSAGARPNMFVTEVLE